MKKIIISILLCLIILSSFSFVIIKAQSLGSKNNYFNRTWREKFAVSDFWRKVFSLHYDGDGKSDYLGSRYSTIQIEVDVLEKQAILPSVLERFADKVKAVTGKNVKYVYSDESIAYQPSLSVEDVNKIVKHHRDYQNQGDTASLYVLIASLDQENFDLIGSSVNEYGMVIYQNSLFDFTKTNPDLYNSYMYSTLLHEFGHQLGLGHNSEPDCLMNEQADESTLYFENPDEVIGDFCATEQAEISKIKARLNP